ATGVVRVGAELRRQYKSNEIPYGPSVGDLVNWATLVADGVTPERAAEETIISMTSDNAEIQDIVRRIVQMVFSSHNTILSRSVQTPQVQQSKQTESPQEKSRDEERAPKETRYVESPEDKYGESYSDSSDADFDTNEDF
ncbi:MAG: CbbQ/NirQ/NorQ C-terminal domain-containing protein, partial [Nitrososphaerales archaeon]